MKLKLEHFYCDEMSDILNFIKETIKLKNVERAGWKLKNINNTESVADHTFSLAILSMVFAQKLNLDVNKCVKMAVIHDTGEVYTGDIVTRFREEDQKVTNAEKKKMGDEATRKLFSLLPSENQKEFLNLWEEYEERKSPESQLVKDLDYLEFCIQLLEYQNRTKINLIEFLQTADAKIKNAEVRKTFEEIRELMQK